MSYVTVNGTNGPNLLPFVGVVGFYSETLINPYSGYTVTVSGIKNINNAIYDGRASNDTLSMSAMGDVLTLVDAFGTIMVKDVEEFNGGFDDDVINMSHATVTYGDIVIRGSLGNDILWANIGNDIILAFDGFDIVDGGPGNDRVYGGNDDDYLSGGTGVDTLFGGEGNDTLAYTIDGLWGNQLLSGLGSHIPFAAFINLIGKNQSFDTFDGDATDDLTEPTAGTDTLIMTEGADVLVISDTVSPYQPVYTPRVTYMDVINALGGDDVVDLSGADHHVGSTIHGGDGNDVLGGTIYADTITGDADNDRLYGAEGDDRLEGGTGDDGYYYELGDGSDTIVETSGTDKITFGPGITFADLTLTVTGADLIIGIGAETITIQNHYAADLSGRVEGLVFDDASTFGIGSYVPNEDPVANDDSFTGNEDEVIIGNVIANDTDADGDTLTTMAQTFTTANGGTVTIAADGSFSYTGAANFNGIDGFDYTINDGMGRTDTAHVDLTIGAVNDAPVANDDSYAGFEDMPVTGNVLDNDVDADGDTLSVDAQVITTVNGGSVTLNADGTFTYQGAANFNGNDAFSYTARDASGATSTANVLLAIAAVNDAPSAVSDLFTGYRNETITGNVMLNDTDVDGDAIFVTAGTIQSAGNGTVELNADGTFTYTPAEGWVGSDSFNYMLNDGQGGSAATSVQLDVVLERPDTIYGTNNANTIDGTAGDETILGFGGDDTLKGQGGDDTLLGGSGNDILYGDDGILTGATYDKVFADPNLMPELIEGVNITNLRPKGDPALGINEGNLTVDYDATAQITFRKGYAGYDNSFGVFAIAADGTIQNASLEWGNVKNAGVNVAHDIDLPVGANGGAYGFFIIANGNNENNGYTGLNISGEGNIKFVYNYGQASARAATITDPANKVSVIYNDGITTKVLSGNVYMTTERGDSTVANEDGKIHVVSGLLDANNKMLNVTNADLAAKPVTFSKNDFTISATMGTLVAHNNRIGVKSTTSGGDVISGNEALHIVLANGAQKMTVSLSDISGGTTGIDFKVFLNGDTTHPIAYEYVTGSVTGGKIDIVLNASDFGAGLITGIDVSSVSNSARGVETFFLDNILAEIPGGTDTNTLRIGFEDLYNTGDADYEDVLFDLDIKPVTTSDMAGGNDILDGGAGNDTLYGEGGNDLLFIGLGADHAFGGTGADTFALNAIDGQFDTIHDFNVGQGDKINITDVLESYDPLSDDISNFVHLVQNGANTELQINADGDVGGAFVTAALILGGSGGTDVGALIASGTLIADQSALA